MPTIGERWRRAQRGYPERFPLVQAPNPPLFLALGGWLVSVLTEDSVHAYAQATMYAGLAAWAWEELADGVNWFRRVLGLGGLVLVVVRVGRALGG